MEVDGLLAEGDIALGVATKNKQSALTKIARGLSSRAGVDERVILSGLLAREQIASTAMGNGVAIPHALLDALRAPLASLTCLVQPIDFDAPDNERVDLLFTLLWPRSDIRNFLPALAQVCRVFRHENLRNLLRQAGSPAAALAVMNLSSVQSVESLSSAEAIVEASARNLSYEESI
jgi:PTS system nitrogen regulatory IIA component